MLGHGAASCKLESPEGCLELLLVAYVKNVLPDMSESAGMVSRAHDSLFFAKEEGQVICGALVALNHDNTY